MQNPTDDHAAAAPEWWQDYAAEFGPLWHPWQARGTLYARRLKSSPPVVCRAADPAALADEIRAEITRRPSLGGSPPGGPR